MDTSARTGVAPRLILAAASLETCRLRNVRIMHGLLNLLKPPGMTSHDAVAFVRRVLREKRVGHTGTLDPAAAGVLPICVGAATRLVEYLQAGTKAYTAEAVFGTETDSGDLLGLPVANAETIHLTPALVAEHLEAFRGEIEQTPPLHSAIKVDGKKLYEIARAGGEVEIPTRRVTISKLELTSWIPGDPPRALLEMECSSGTYVRSLIRDLAQAAGTRATMSFLVRTRSGAFTLENAVTLEGFAANPQLIDLETAARAAFSTVIDAPALVEHLAHGRRVPAPGGTADSYEPILVADSSRGIFVIARPESGQLAPDKVLRTSEN